MAHSMAMQKVVGNVQYYDNNNNNNNSKLKERVRIVPGREAFD